MTSRIEDYALVGDCETAALVSRDGSIDWLCWPRFDSEACFAALLGDASHGRWRIAPVQTSQVTRRYLPGTLILETEFAAPDGVASIVDFMPLRHDGSHLIRLVRGLRGRVAMRMDLTVRFDYGAIVPWVSRLPDGGLQAIAGADMVVLRTSIPLHGENLSTVGEFEIEAGQTVSFSLSYAASHLAPPVAPNPEVALSTTQTFWLEWSSRCQYRGDWAEAVTRSHILLKALTYAPTGAIVAAPTTSLPEAVGGTRNWDYRFCWLRDATFTLLSLLQAGYRDEALAWRDWLLRAVAGSPSQVQIMYAIDGERLLTEWQADWLPGYEASRPVRIGNAAAKQLQLDVFGEVMDAMDQARRAGLAHSDAGWALQRALVTHLEGIWDRPDEGIWEVRGPSRQFTHSKVMAWVALDRAVRGIEQFGLDGPLDRWRALRQRIHDDVCRHGFNAEIGSFVQSYGSTHLDASLLLIPLVGFLSPQDPRIRGTVAAIERHLVQDGLVLRYHTHEAGDGLPPGEGAFLACSFWLADNLALQGRRSEAVALFERLLALRNDVGLLAEEYDPVLRRQLGNFPQAFSHLAMVDTARNLSMLNGPAGVRASQATADPSPAAR